ncbi:hypothetical protein [Methylobacterium sp. J-068]|uniref:hypothetical protein n=1 Tax=Methylobacterium sp. J-068 TaxID=2836649 RepID=UPI00391D1995
MRDVLSDAEQQVSPGMFLPGEMRREKGYVGRRERGKEQVSLERVTRFARHENEGFQSTAAHRQGAFMSWATFAHNPTIDGS